MKTSLYFELMNVFALDFDGVLCDSVGETAVTAWRAGRQVWPQWQGLEPPEEIKRRFIKLRPVVETGYQTILLMALIQQNIDDEAIESCFGELCLGMLRETRYSSDQYAQLFNQTRAEWMHRDLQDWLGRHRFYPGTAERVVEAVNAGTPVFILTTKQERFVEALLQGQGIAFPRERLFGLDYGKKKEDILEKLLQHSDFQRAQWHFVEDRLPTLQRVLARESLQRVRLYLAGWGYNTVQDRAYVREHPSLTLWNPDAFLVV